MIYSNEEIDEFIKILKSYVNEEEPQSNKVVCKNCNTFNFVIESGQYYCKDCGLSQGHVLGYYDKKEYERFYFRQKSIYQRKYHYKNEINKVCNKFKIVLTENEKYQLDLKLMEIDNDKLKKLNKKLKRNRMINIYFIIRKMLKILNDKQHKKIELNLSDNTLKFYKKWFKDYILLK